MDINKFFIEYPCFYSVRNEALNLVNSVLDIHKSLFSDEAVNNLCESYLEYIASIYVQLIFAEDNLKSAVSKEQAEAIINKIAQKTDGANPNYFSEKYPLFAGFHERLKNNFTRFLQDFITRLLANQEKISDFFFDGRKFTQIKKLKIYLSNTRKAQNVVKIFTDYGNIFYKPHNCNIDLIYEKIISSFFSDCSKTPHVLAQKNYAFISEIYGYGLESVNDAEKYFYNFGALSALFTALGTRDIHFENIIPCGVLPVIIDVEALINGERPSIDFHDKSLFLNKDFIYSIMKTSIMPLRIFDGSPITSPLYPQNSTASKSHLPFFGDEIFSVKGRENNFIAGFIDGYNRVLKHKQEILNLFENEKNLLLRTFMRNPQFYVIINQYLLKPAALSSSQAQEKYLKNLLVGLESIKADSDLENVINYERDCLLNCDIPYYCINSHEKNLYGIDNSKLVQENYLINSPIDTLKERFARLSQSELNFELDCIKILFKNAPFDTPKANDFPIKASSSSKKIILNVINEIWQDLNASIIRGTDGFPLWHSITSINETLQLEPFTLWMSAAVFCEKIKSLHDTQSLKNLCVKALKAQLEIWKTQPEEKIKSTIFPGLFYALGGMLLTFDILHEFNARDDLLALIREKSLYKNSECSIDFGTAGLLFALLKTRQNQLVKPCAEYLISQINENLPDDLDKIAGIADVLAGAYKVTGEKIFAETSNLLFDGIMKRYSQKLKGWPDDKDLFGNIKSHVAGAIAFHAQNAGCLELAELAAESILSDNNLLYLDSLRKGNSLNILALLKLNYHKETGQIISAMIERYRDKKTFNIMPDGVKNSFDASFFYGTLGIGFALIEYLRLTPIGD